MKNALVLIAILSSWLTVYSQTDYSEVELKQKCDSIIEESNLLYRYETASWNFTDMFLPKKDIMKSIQGVLTYQQGDSIKCIVIGEKSKCIYEASFLTDSKPCTEVTFHRNLSEYEMHLLRIREKIRGALGQYQISVYEGFPLNWILIPFENGYKFYAVSGTSKGGVIPFGNDYLFIADKEGEILSWKKFHSRLVTVETTEEIPMITFPMHSHLKQEPFISATDICTFRLYYNQTGSTMFGVYSPALSLYFVYKIATNEIVMTKDISSYLK